LARLESLALRLGHQLVAADQLVSPLTVTSTASASLRPAFTVTGCTVVLPPSVTSFHTCPSASALAGTANTGCCSASVGRWLRNSTRALISGRMPSAKRSNFTLVITVALARSTVGTMLATWPRKRWLGRASSVISTGCPTFTRPKLPSLTSASTSRVERSASVSTAPWLPAALEKGVMRSPTLAFLASTTPSNGARISV
jgi:hypothetical protein